MKKILFLIIITLTLSNCNSADCFESAGVIIEQEITVSNFDKITVGHEISLVLKHGSTQRIVISTGENLINNIAVEVIDGRLYLEDKNSCNFTRDYAITTVYVTSPNITEIRSDTARKISSDGILNYNDLLIFSEDFHVETLTNGEIDLNVACQNLRIVSNGASLFTFNGETEKLFITFASGDSRFLGSNLIADEIIVSQKSTNDMLIHPVNKLIGHIFSLGDVIAFHQPALVNVTEHYTGKLIFN